MFKIVAVADVRFSCLFLLILTVAGSMGLVWFNTFVTQLTISRAFLRKKHYICIRERTGGSCQDRSQKEKQTLLSLLVFVSALKASLRVATHGRPRLTLTTWSFMPLCPSHQSERFFRMGSPFQPPGSLPSTGPALHLWSSEGYRTRCFAFSDHVLLQGVSLLQ